MLNLVDDLPVESVSRSPVEVPSWLYLPGAGVGVSFRPWRSGVEVSLEAPGAPPATLEAPSLPTAPPRSSRQPRSSPDQALLGRAAFCLGLAALGVAGDASSARPLTVAALAREGGRRRIGGSSSPKRLLPERPKDPKADEGRRESGCLASAMPGATHRCSCGEPTPKSFGTFLPPIVMGEGEV
eukprot:scaffold35757_cov52-Phaeocystis_antarctica.AAC.5